MNDSVTWELNPAKPYFQDYLAIWLNIHLHIPRYIKIPWINNTIFRKFITEKKFKNYIIASKTSNQTSRACSILSLTELEITYTYMLKPTTCVYLLETQWPSRERNQCIYYNFFRSTVLNCRPYLGLEISAPIKLKNNTLIIHLGNS